MKPCTVHCSLMPTSTRDARDLLTLQPPLLPGQRRRRLVAALVVLPHDGADVRRLRERQRREEPWPYRDVERLGRRGGLRSSAACLSAVFRQRDAAFVSLLNELRVGRASSDVARALEATNAL